MGKMMGNFVGINRDKWNMMDLSGNHIKLLAKAIYIEMLIQAPYWEQTKTVAVGPKNNQSTIEVGRGQILIDRRCWFYEQGIDHKTADRVMDHMVLIGLLAVRPVEIKPTRRDLVTILNYDDIQGFPTTDPQVTHNRTTTDPQVTHNRPTSDPQVTHNHHENPNDIRNVEPPNNKQRTTNKKQVTINKGFPEPPENAQNISNQSIDPASQALAPVLVSPKKDKPPTGSLVWEAYKDSYQAKYGVPPIRNAQVNSICKQIVDRVGFEEAPNLVRFYLTHDNKFYLSKCHQLKYCLSDAEKLYTEMKKGIKMTRGTAEAVEAQQENDAQYHRVMAMLEQRRKANERK